MVKEGRWAELSVGAGKLLVGGAKQYKQDMWATARDEHTIISTLFPADVEVKGTNLSDVQMIQIFWMEVVLELTMLALIYTPAEPGEDEGLSFSPISMIIEACLVVAPVIVSVMIFRALFKWGNRGRKLKVKRERPTAYSGKVALASGSEETRETAKAVELAKASKTEGQTEGKPTTERRRRRVRRLTRRQMRGYCLYSIPWCIILGTELVCILVLMIICSQKLGPDDTKGFLLSWSTALGMAWLIVEPFEIALVVFFPGLLKNKYVARIRQAAKDLGVV